MPRKISPEAFFERANNNVAIEKKKDVVNGKQVLKELQPKTKQNYARALALWDQYEKQNPGVSPNIIETSKDYIMSVALGIEGGYGSVKPGLGTVVQYYKDFTAGWRRARMEEEQENEDKTEEGKKELVKVISPIVTLSTSNFIKYELYNILELPLRKRLRRYGSQIHFLHLGTLWWKNDWFVLPKPRRRPELWALTSAIVFSTSRIGEYIESTCRIGSGRGLRFKGTIFAVFRNKCGNTEFAVQLERDAKCMTFTPDKRPEHALHEGAETRPLFCNPMLVIVAMCIARNAFRDYKSIDEILALEPPEDEQMVHLHWNPSVLELPFFEGSDGKMETASAFGRYLREWGFRAGYNEPPTVHDFRAEGLILTDRNYSQDTRMKQGGQRDPSVYRDHYAANNAGVDGQATFFHDKNHRTDITDLFRSLHITRNPELWQSLPAEKRHELEQSAEFKDVEANLEKFSDNALSKNERKELQARKRKLISEALRKCREEQPARLASKVDAYKKECTGRHRTIFERARKLMPVRDRLASSMFIVATIRSDAGKAVLQDLVELYLQEEEVAFRPGLELDKCHCLRKTDSQSAATRWRHIYSCHRKWLKKDHELVEFCFLCSIWFVDQEGWNVHCQAHLNKPETIPTQCNPLTYGGTLAAPGFCPDCLGNESLPPEIRMQQFLETAEWKDHIHNQHSEDSKSLLCPLHKLHCGESFMALQELQFHLEDVHCVGFRSNLKRARSVGEGRAGPAKRKRVSRRRLSRWKKEDLEYGFVDESNTFRNQTKRSSHSTPAKAPSSTNSGFSPTPEIISDQNVIEDDTPPSSWCGESKNGSDSEDAFSDGANDEDWEFIDDVTISESGEVDVNERNDNFQSINFHEESWLGLRPECASVMRVQLDPALSAHKDEQNEEEEEEEYEVEKILEARILWRKLKYRVKWVGYDDDQKWYNAANFKNSPHKLYNFHKDNPAKPGPSQRLKYWMNCWKEDRDAEDHPDDNKPVDR
ncbi:unnamed protein product [Periconia digitata]|uniref:Chromo domain-containing protein n=1 Tax=Periconia digitata TaxID=1303443 RepID=A0A9W4UUI0_9PLEO|nr:unnamed protein product [Periconia digitata]